MGRPKGSKNKKQKVTKPPVVVHHADGSTSTRKARSNPIETKKRAIKAAEMYLQGVNQTDIGKALAVPQQSVSKMLRRDDIAPLMQKGLQILAESVPAKTKEFMNMVDKYKDGMTFDQELKWFKQYQKAVGFTGGSNSHIEHIYIQDNSTKTINIDSDVMAKLEHRQNDEDGILEGEIIE